MAQEATISLVFGLKEGSNPDLEIVSLVTLEWVRSIQAAAKAIDPNASVKVVYVSTERGSLRKIAVLIWEKTRGKEILLSIAAGSAFFGVAVLDEIKDRVVVNAVDYLEDDILPEITSFFDDGDENEDEDEDEDQDSVSYLMFDTGLQSEFTMMLRRSMISGEVQHHRRNIFFYLQQDPTIRSIGVSIGERGSEIANVPSRHFSEYEDFWSSDSGYTKEVEHVLDVTLSENPPSSVTEFWRFHQYGMGPLNAIMEDVEFLSELRLGELEGRLNIGAEMKIRVKVRMRATSMGWRAIRGGKSVIQVLYPRKGASEMRDNLYTALGPVGNTRNMEDC